MTNLLVDYWNFLESKRSNLSNESIKRDQLQETIRANQAQEALSAERNRLTSQQLVETQRHNKVTEQLTFQGNTLGNAVRFASISAFNQGFKSTGLGAGSSKSASTLSLPSGSTVSTNANGSGTLLLNSGKASTTAGQALLGLAATFGTMALTPAAAVAAGYAARSNPNYSGSRDEFYSKWDSMKKDGSWDVYSKSLSIYTPNDGWIAYQQGVKLARQRGLSEDAVDAFGQIKKGWIWNGNKF